ncbi:MAG TPA: hypothetical protein VFB89_06135 [Gemmatimonadales bacterium]|nr:hypothetical protein [Gemmatimonadales bacterium]
MTQAQETHCRIWLSQIKRLAALGQAARVLASLRAADGCDFAQEANRTNLGMRR